MMYPQPSVAAVPLKEVAIAAEGSPSAAEAKTSYTLITPDAASRAKTSMWLWAVTGLLSVAMFISGCVLVSRKYIEVETCVFDCVKTRLNKALYVPAIVMGILVLGLAVYALVIGFNRGRFVIETWGGLSTVQWNAFALRLSYHIGWLSGLLLFAWAAVPLVGFLIYARYFYVFIPCCFASCIGLIQFANCCVQNPVNTQLSGALAPPTYVQAPAMVQAPVIAPAHSSPQPIYAPLYAPAPIATAAPQLYTPAPNTTANVQPPAAVDALPQFTVITIAPSAPSLSA